VDGGPALTLQPPLLFQICLTLVYAAATLRLGSEPETPRKCVRNTDARLHSQSHESQSVLVLALSYHNALSTPALATQVAT
jgi:hypothetical protein